MSADILAALNLNLDARCTREVKENRGEGEENQVEGSEDEEHHADLRSQRARPNTQQNPAAVRRRHLTATAVTLGVMYLLILAGVFVRSVSVTLEKDQLQTSYEQQSNNNSQLQEIISSMAVNNSQLQTSYDQLQTSYETLSKNHIQLQAEVKQLRGKIEGKWCPAGWKRFGCSCYFKSTEKKAWSASRSDCWNKGADLVVINDKEEQKFVVKLNEDGESWIGLWEKWTTSGWVWEWVDGSPPTETFWASGLQQHSLNKDGAACCNQQGRWTKSAFYGIKNWICEK